MPDSVRNPLSHLPFPPSGPVPTVRILSDEVAAGFIIINASDFDPARHTKYEDALAADPAAESEPKPSARRRGGAPEGA